LQEVRRLFIVFGVLLAADSSGADCVHPGALGRAPIWISWQQILQLPDSGKAFEAVKAEADEPAVAPVLSADHEDLDLRVLAKAYLFVKTGQQHYRDEAISMIDQTRESENGGRTLELGRNLLGVVIAAELVGLPSPQRELFEEWLDGVRREELNGRTLISTHEDRPNNWGTYAGASRMAADIYLGDTEDLQKAIRVFRGYLGDVDAYDGFSFGDDLSWHADKNRPVGINPLGALKDGFSIDGVIPDDQRRGGTFAWPPPDTNYPWGALQGVIAQAVILYGQGYEDVFEWQDRALLRAYRWLYDEADNPARSDDEWQMHLVNYYYGTDFETETPARIGKNMGWTDWTHASP
jgi:hypothetical protein